MNWAAILTALSCGAALAVQVGANSALRSRMGSPLLAALASFSIGISLLLGFLAVAQPERPSWTTLRAAPWWSWTGGALGAIYITCAAFFAPKLGAAGWLGLIVAGQVVSSLALDHFGLVGFAVHPVSAWRLIGAALLMAGVTIVLRN